MSTPGKSRKGAGINLVLSNESIAWKNQYMTCAANWLRRNQFVTGEDVRMYMICAGYKKPHHPNTWGAMWNSVTNEEGWVEKTMMTRALIFANSNARNSAIWKSLMYVSPDAPSVQYIRIGK